MTTRRLLLAIAVALVSVLASATRADAYQYAIQNGSSGRVIETSPMYVADLNGPYGAVQTFGTNSGPLVARSPWTTGTQSVIALYTLQRWSGSTWYNVTQGSSSGRISPGQTAIRFGRFTTQPTPMQAGAGSYRLAIAFSWADAAGRNLGSSVIVSRHYGDFQCVTRGRYCESMGSYVSVGKWGFTRSASLATPSTSTRTAGLEQATIGE